MPNTTPRRKILGISTTALGDTLLNIPAINAIGREHDIDLVVHSRNSELFHHNPLIRRVIPYRNNQLFRRYVALRLWRERYDRAVVLHANSDVLELLKLVHYGKAFAVQPWNVPELRLYQIYYDPAEHHIDKRMRLAHAVGVDGMSEPMALELTPQELDWAAQWLDSNHVLRPYLAVCLGASLPYRRWPVERFGQFLRQFCQTHPGYGIVVLGSRSELPLFRVAKEYCPAVVPAIGLGLRQLAAILRGAELLLTNDTGPMHMGQAVGTRVLALFGPSDPVTIGPRGVGHKVIAVGPTCKPCVTKKCKHPVCMEQIPVEKVLEVASGIIGASPGRAAC